MTAQPKDPAILSDPIAQAWRRGELDGGEVLTPQPMTDTPDTLVTVTAEDRGAASVPSAVTDPMERIIAQALQAAGFAYVTDHGGGNPSGLDFKLLGNGVEIEVKRFHSPRIAEQMSRAENVIAVQGKEAVRFFAALIYRCGYTPAQGASGSAQDRHGLDPKGAGPVRDSECAQPPSSPPEEPFK